MARETRSAWVRRVERWQRSGLTADRFAAQEGVNARTLAFWRWRLKRDGASGGAQMSARRAEKRVAFVELVAPKPAAAPRETRSTPIEVVLPIGYRVRVAAGFERAALVELLDVLEARR
ncbi:MAG: IS66 family insertion sequence element accessory protein TnpB [Thermodesulfobacteriota bacterium]